MAGARVASVELCKKSRTETEISIFGFQLLPQAKDVVARDLRLCGWKHPGTVLFLAVFNPPPISNVDNIEWPLQDFIAFGLTGASVVIVVGCWALVVNLYTAPKILHEKRSIIDLIAGGMIIAGISLAVGALLSTGREDPDWTAEELVDRFIDPLVLVLLAVVIVLAIVSYINTRMYARKYPHLHMALTHHDAHKSEPGAEGTEETKTDNPDAPDIEMISASIRYQHVLLSACVGTLTVVTAKVRRSSVWFVEVSLLNSIPRVGDIRNFGSNRLR